MNISGNTVFIPGATGGIGLALALRLQAAGNEVVIGGRRTALLDELRAEHGFGTVRIDTSDPDSIREASARVLEEHPDVNVLVAMAGIMRVEDWHEPQGFLESAEQVVTTNLLGPIRLIAAFIEHLRARPQSTILTVSSGIAFVPLAATPSYNASKAGVHQLSESIRLQLADTSVDVVELVPPSVQSDLLPGQSENEDAMPLEEFLDQVMELLTTRPDADDVVVERAAFLRYAEARGEYAEVTRILNDRDPHGKD